MNFHFSSSFVYVFRFFAQRYAKKLETFDVFDSFVFEKMSRTRGKFSLILVVRYFSGPWLNDLLMSSYDQEYPTIKNLLKSEGYIFVNNLVTMTLNKIFAANFSPVYHITKFFEIKRFEGSRQKKVFSRKKFYIS